MVPVKVAIFAGQELCRVPVKVDSIPFRAAGPPCLRSASAPRYRLRRPAGVGWIRGSSVPWREADGAMRLALSLGCSPQRDSPTRRRLGAGPRCPYPVRLEPPGCPCPDVLRNEGHGYAGGAIRVPPASDVPADVPAGVPAGVVSPRRRKSQIRESDQRLDYGFAAFRLAFLGAGSSEASWYLSRTSSAAASARPASFVVVVILF